MDLSKEAKRISRETFLKSTRKMRTQIINKKRYEPVIDDSYDEIEDEDFLFWKQNHNKLEKEG